MKLKTSIIAFATFAVLGALPASASLVAYWNFNGLSIATASAPGVGTVPTSIAADTGTGTVGLSGWLGTVDDFGGSTLNSSGGAVAGASLSLLGSGPGAGPYPGNGSFITISFSMTDLENPALTFATQKTATGFGSNQVAYSTDGANYTDFGTTYTPAASFGLQTFDFSSIDALDNAATVYLKITFSGTTSSSGNNRIDNLQINTVPEPAAILLCSLGLLGILRRRR